MVDITIPIIDICCANTAPIPKTFLYFMNEKINENAKNFKINQNAGESCTPYRYRSLT